MAGGGAFQSTLYNCTLSGNSADSGGGASGSTLRNCTLTGNSASDIGGGGLGSRLYNCTVTGNTANAAGGGVAGESGSWGMGGRWAPSTLYNCLVYSNQAPFGANWAGLYINGDYGGTRTYSYSHCTFEHSCTTPLPEGQGNIEADPQLASATHLLPTSPCLGAGNAAYATGVDIDGEPWASLPAIGADQLWPGQSIGLLGVRIVVPFTRFALGFAVAFTADNTGPILRTVWDFSDGIVVTNQPFVSHAWTAPGTYTVRLTGYNDSHPEGVTTSVEVEVLDAVHYVDAANATPVFPYTSWATAATSIQDAVDAGNVTGRLVLVSDGVYELGAISGWLFVLEEIVDLPSLASKLKHPARAVDRWLLEQLSPATEQALELYEGATSDPSPLQVSLMLDLNGILHGPAIYDSDRFEGVELRWEIEDLLWRDPRGDDLIHLNRMLIEDAYPRELAPKRAWTGGLSRVFLRDTVALQSMNGPEVTVIEGAQRNPETGAGTDARCVYVGDNAVLSGFTLRNGGAGNGGGVFSEPGGVLTNCFLTGNSAGSGGGASGGTLYNCTLSGNSAGSGGGAWRSTLYNCTVTGNSAGDGGGGADESTLYNCTVSGNSAGWSGGASGGTLYNCTVTGNSAGDGGGGVSGWPSPCMLYNCLVYFNQAPEGANWHYECRFDHSCTTPLPEGPGNIDADPGFVDAAAGDYRLRYGSPCIDAGSPQTSTAHDLAGLPRPIDGNGDGRPLPDMGAYEFDLRTVVPPDWLAEHGLDATDPHVLSYDSDGDAQTSFQEWLSGNDPNDPFSFFRIEDVEAGPPVTVSYRSLTGRVYTLYTAPDIELEPGGSILWTPLSGQVAVPGTGGLDTLTDTDVLPRRFYRVGVELP